MTEQARPTLVTCPECGTAAMVTLNRREAGDFCRTCDYPLFWTPAQIVHDDTAVHDLSLRRLPGTVGRATVAALPCPHCAEPNPVGAEVCIRCGLPLHPVAPPPEPEPEPVYVPPPPLPEPEPEPEDRIPWWVWALVCIALAGVVALVTILILDELR